jgi:soluble lytic murein transglycosylase-like protein
VAAFIMALTAPHIAEGRGKCNSRACEIRVAMKQCSQTRVVPCIRRAALHHRVDFSMLLRKARCESGLNPYAINGAPFNRAPVRTSKSTGLMQFMPGTWQTTPYRHRSIWSAKWNALAGAWMHRADIGRGGEWVCR